MTYNVFGGTLSLTQSINHWWHCEGHGVKGQVAMAVEILLTRQFPNQWRDLNKNLHSYSPHS